MIGIVGNGFVGNAVHQNFKDELIDSKKLIKFLESSKKKNKDISLFDATKLIKYFNKKTSKNNLQN